MLVSRRGPTTPGGQVLLVWAVPVSFATTQGIDSLYFPLDTEMFHFSGFASLPLWIQDRIVIADRVSPFGHLRISLCAAPRSLSQLATSFIAGCRQGIHSVACNFLPLTVSLRRFQKNHSRHNEIITFVVIPLCANCQRTQSVCSDQGSD